MSHSTWTTKIVGAIAVLILLAVWQMGSVSLDASVILPTPASTLSVFGSLVSSRPFGLNVSATVSRALRSFAIIFLTGTVLGILAGYSPHVHAFLTPFLLICKATPVMSVILLAFIWFSSGTVPLFSAFLMGFPVMFIQVEQGVKLISPQLREMTCLYGFTSMRRLFHLVVPSMAPSIITGARTSLSMVWKVVIAAEVLTVPQYGIGSRMHMAQVQLETAEVLAWTFVAVLLTAAGDLLFTVILKAPGFPVKKRHRRSLQRDGSDPQ